LSGKVIERNVNEENTLVPDVLYQNNENVINAPYTVADPDLQISVGGGASRPWDKGVGVSIFLALRASVWSKNKGGGRAPPLDPPLLYILLLPQRGAIFHAIEKDKSEPLACTRDMMNNEVKARIHNQ